MRVYAVLGCHERVVLDRSLGAPDKDLAVELDPRVSTKVVGLSFPYPDANLGGHPQARKQEARRQGLRKTRTRREEMAPGRADSPCNVIDRGAVCGCRSGCPSPGPADETPKRENAKCAPHAQAHDRGEKEHRTLRPCMMSQVSE